MDYASYSMYNQVGQDAEALLDPQTLYSLANKTFATYFQHFASFNVSITNGSFAYQYINETLPPDLGDVDGPAEYGTSNPSPISHTNRTVAVQITRPVKVLRVSPIALWLSVGILVWLIATTIVVVVVEKRWLAKLVGGTKTLADRAILMAGSDALLNRVASGRVGQQKDGTELQTKLGWFRDKRGDVRWGIELFGEGSGVEWLDEDMAGKGVRPPSTRSSSGRSTIVKATGDGVSDRTVLEKKGPTVTVQAVQRNDGQIATWI